jgi:hypothetical protein
MATAPDRQLLFKSSRFVFEIDEDVVANASRRRMQLAEWLRDKLAARGCGPIEIITDNTGWSLMCARKPFLLWVRCEIVWDIPLDPEDEDDTEALWACFVETKKPLLTGFFKQIDPAATEKLFKDVENILSSESHIEFVEVP